MNMIKLLLTCILCASTGVSLAMEEQVSIDTQAYRDLELYEPLKKHNAEIDNDIVEFMHDESAEDRQNIIQQIDSQVQKYKLSFLLKRTSADRTIVGMILISNHKNRCYCDAGEGYEHLIPVMLEEAKGHISARSLIAHKNDDDNVDHFIRAGFNVVTKDGDDYLYTKPQSFWKAHRTAILGCAALIATVSGYLGYLWGKTSPKANHR